MDYINMLIMISKFGLGISLIVGIHELGHMLFAKAFGMRVESYMIGFPPKIFSFKWGETEYSLGALPLGGAVKIAGMIDESMDDSYLDRSKKPWEFRSKSKFKQLIVMLGGVIFNLTSAFLIHIAILYMVGGAYLPKEELNKHGIAPTELGMTIGLKRGDKILKKNNNSFEDFDQLQNNLGSTLSYVVMRQGKKIHINVSSSVLNEMKMGNRLMYPLHPFIINKVVPHSVATRVGLQKGDTIIAINGHSTPYLQDLLEVLDANAGKTISLKYSQAGIVYNKKVKLSNNGKIGVHLASTLKNIYKSYSILKSAVASLYIIADLITTQAKGLVNIVTRKVSFSQAVSGPIGMVKIFDTVSDFCSFWALIAFISVLIAFMNLLPIPALDGGHAMILLYEMVTRRELPNKWRIRLQKIGMFILLLIMFFALYNDLYKF